MFSVVDAQQKKGKQLHDLFSAAGAAEQMTNGKQQQVQVLCSDCGWLGQQLPLPLQLNCTVPAPHQSVPSDEHLSIKHV
jgi:hypothetical protein